MFLRLQKGFLNTSFQPIKELEDESNMEELDQPTDFKDLPVRIDWNGELPANIVVPRVDLHSLVLDFAAVSFLDISALKGLKMVNVSLTAATGAVIFPNANFFFFISFIQALRELIRVEVEVYIVACDRKYKSAVFKDTICSIT